MFQRLMPLAIANVAVHVVGLLFAAFGMRPGSSLAPFPERMQYLARHPLGWSAGWGVWMLCDFAVIAFVVQSARRLRNDWAHLAVGLILIGCSVDLACDCLFIVVLPDLAVQEPVNAQIFLTVEKGTNTISLAVANGLITLSAAAMTAAICLGEKRTLPIFLLGAAILVFGLLLSAAAFMSSPWLTEWATGPTILSYCVWCLVVAHRLDRWEPAR
jgi:hypothetical protein